MDLRPQVALVFLASIVVSSRILSLVTSLLLTVQLCSCPQPLSGRPGYGGSLSVVRPPMTDAPVDRMIQALLDTGATGRSGADATGGLLAAPRGPHGAPAHRGQVRQPARAPGFSVAASHVVLRALPHLLDSQQGVGAVLPRPLPPRRSPTPSLVCAFAQARSCRKPRAIIQELTTDYLHKFIIQNNLLSVI